MYLHLRCAAIAFGAACLTLPGPAIAKTNESNLTVITHKNNHINDSIDRRTLVSLYSMRAKRWPNGKRLTVVVLPDDADTHLEFCLNKLRILPHHLRRNWDRLIFSGKSGLLVTVDTPEEMRQFVSKTEGAIGYIPQVALDDSVTVVEVR